MARQATVAVLWLALSTACSTARVVRLDTGQGTPLEHKPLVSIKPVMVETGAFEEALARLVLVERLRLRPPEQGWLVPASHHDTSAEARWRQLMARSFGGPCRPGQRGTTCLSLLDDVLGWDSWDKLGIALALSFEPMKASISRAVEDTLAPQLFHGIIATGLVTWLVLAANPEPVFTKSMAIVSVLMLAYLGVEKFLDAVAASWELKQATDRATSLAELWQAGQRYGDRVGPQVAQVLVLAVTMVAGAGTAGGTALLASRLAMLPRFAQAAAVGASGLGIKLVIVGQVSAVTAVGSTVVISLPAAAVAMTAAGAEAAKGVKDIPGSKPPFKGEPGTTARGQTQSRSYDKDGYPRTDRDLGHPDEAGLACGDHCHDWSGPAGGGPPTAADRGVSRLPTTQDPPAPRGPGVPPENP